MPTNPDSVTDLMAEIDDAGLSAEAREALKEADKLREYERTLERIREYSARNKISTKALQEAIQAEIAALRKKLKARAALVQRLVGVLRKGGSVALLAGISLFTDEALAGVEAFAKPGSQLNGFLRAVLRGDCERILGLLRRSGYVKALEAELAAAGVRNPLVIDALVKRVRAACEKN
ncbi:MAG: hypothetical protein HYZ53_21810 [Planctomycetes bacterium]|nr:hypothetical protein [Planctomycetota bacterium]